MILKMILVMIEDIDDDDVDDIDKDIYDNFYYIQSDISNDRRYR